MDQRILRFEGVTNFRDYGGYATVGGGRVKTGKLFRSAHHGRATDPDLAEIAALDIAVVVDLRHVHERTRDPSRRHPAFAPEVIQSDIGEDADDSWRRFLLESDLSPDAFHDHALRFYREAPFEARYVDLYSRYFRALAHSGGGTLIHCAAGKDRTGILAALTHHLLGVHPDDAIADYLLTNQAVDFEGLIPMLSDAIFRQLGRRPSPEATRVAMSVELAYLENALAEIKAVHGGLDAYMADRLGVDAAARDAIAARLLA